MNREEFITAFQVELIDQAISETEQFIKQDPEEGGACPGELLGRLIDQLDTLFSTRPEKEGPTAEELFTLLKGLRGPEENSTVEGAVHLFETLQELAKADVIERVCFFLYSLQEIREISNVEEACFFLDEEEGWPTSCAMELVLAITLDPGSLSETQEEQERRQATAKKQVSEMGGERARNLEKQYGPLSPEDYAKVLQDQEGVCAVCAKTPEELGKELVVDYHPGTGRVRGLLCRHCNGSVAIAEYLRGQPSEETP